LSLSRFVHPRQECAASFAAFGTSFAATKMTAANRVICPRISRACLAIFLAAAALYGTLRDWVTSQTVAKGTIVFGAGAHPWVADYAAWLTGCGLAQAIQIALRGDPRRERLARTPAER
jgi:hypothetical protein